MISVNNLCLSLLFSLITSLMVQQLQCVEHTMAVCILNRSAWTGHGVVGLKLHRRDHRDSAAAPRGAETCRAFTVKEPSWRKSCWTVSDGFHWEQRVELRLLCEVVLTLWFWPKNFIYTVYHNQKLRKHKDFYQISYFSIVTKCSDHHKHVVRLWWCHRVTSRVVQNCVTTHGGTRKHLYTRLIEMSISQRLNTFHSSDKFWSV